MASDQNENPIVEGLRQVLEPLGAERRDLVIGWALEYASRCPMLVYCCAKGERGDVDWIADPDKPGQTKAVAKTYEFRIGAPNPLDPSYVVFAMFHWHAQASVVVFSFVATADDSGGVPRIFGVYQRDVIHEPRFLSFALTLDALVEDLDYHTHATPWDDWIEPEEPPGLQPNGGSAAGARASR